MSSGEIYSQPTATGTGSDVRTKVLFAITSLKSKSPALVPTATLIADNIRAPEQTPELVSRFRQFLNANEKVLYHKETDSYSYRPVHDIFDADDLIGFLQSQTTASGLNVGDLKDGWADVEKTIDQLEKEQKLLVVRNKKDHHAKMVWADDPTLHAPMDTEFVKFWAEIEMPEGGHEAVVKALKQKGMSSADSGMAPPTKVVKKEKPKKKIRRGGKVTNTHMTGVLRDYSHLKR
jgi:transcription initiation factor TFIIE subunit beta